MNWAELEDGPESLVPLFPVQEPDGKREWRELSRQATLFQLMLYRAPRVYGYAVPNAGKRNPWQARQEGIRAGVFDTHWLWQHPLQAYVEMKGYDARGRAGRLTDHQVRFGNRMTQLGVPCACFFDPHDAVEWLRNLGFPIAEARRAA